MAKYFCSKCGQLTYSLRYIFGEKWEKPIGEPQYCKKCKVTVPKKKLEGATKK